MALTSCPKEVLPAILFCHSPPGLITYWWGNKTRPKWFRRGPNQAAVTLSPVLREAVFAAICSVNDGPKFGQMSATDVNRNAHIKEFLPLVVSVEMVLYQTLSRSLLLSGAAGLAPHLLHSGLPTYRLFCCAQRVLWLVCLPRQGND